ncbi:MAG: FtsX-like permease family protein [Propionibacteriaceae bacterium]|nr:FtsX-like permease family protein [Propionibacteriaceae bacterium]
MTRPSTRRTMARATWRELTFHPARYAATVLAVTIAVAFMAAASMITATESSAIGKQATAPLMTADLIVAPKVAASTEIMPDITSSQVTRALSAVTNVESAEPLSGVTAILSTQSGDQETFAELVTQPHDRFLWTSLREGTWPHGEEVTVDGHLAKKLEVTLGDRISVFGQELTVVGITTDRTSRLSGSRAMVSPEWMSEHFGESYPTSTKWWISLSDHADAQAVKEGLAASIKGLGIDADVYTPTEYAHSYQLSLTNDVDVFKYILWVFAGIAGIVGMITIANTFTILLTTRRRSIGLMRTIGATGSQVRHSIWLEAAAIGLVGAVLGIGVACGISALLGIFTGSVLFGLTIPWMETGIAAGLGVLITLVACVIPARHATRVTPLEALRPVTGEHTSHVSKVRAILCIAGLGLGLALSIVALTLGSSALMFAILGSGIVALSILIGARVFVPPMLKAAGSLVKHSGSVVAIAAKNTVRDPGRASATTTALMLAVGLIVTLQVGAASMGATAMAKVESAFPIDVMVTALGDPDGARTLPARLTQQVEQVPGIDKVVALPCRQMDFAPPGEGYENLQLVCSYLPEISTLTRESTPPADGEILVHENSWHLEAGKQITWESTTLTAVASKVASHDVMLVSPATFAILVGDLEEPGVLFCSAPDTSKMISVIRAVEDIAGGDQGIASVGGSLFDKYVISQVLDIIVGVATALLAIAVFIAVVGVSNTLTLSVMERHHDNAILRALGFKRHQLRLMLLVEALLLTIVGAVVGIVVGVWFGWLGTQAMVSQFGAEEVELTAHFAVNWWQTLALLGILVLAAVLASILPGRRSALASPVEALAEV